MIKQKIITTSTQKRFEYILNIFCERVIFNIVPIQANLIGKDHCEVVLRRIGQGSQ